MLLKIQYLNRMFVHMGSPFMKIAYRLMLAYFISIGFFGLIYYIYNNIILLAVSLALTGIIIFFAGRYLMDKIDRDESIKFPDKRNDDAVLAGAPPEKVKEPKENKEKILDLMQKL